MGFFRSSESKSKSSKSKSRFSFRRQSEEGADVSPPTKASAPLSPPAPTRKRTASPRSHPPAPSSSALRGTIVSSASTSSASSSISSPTALQRAANDSDLETPKPSATTSSSVASAKRTSDSQASTDTEDAADFMRTPSESSILATPRESFDTHENAGPMSMEPSRTANASRKDSSDYTSARASTMVASRHSLVGYKKLQCSMSYKNRMAQGAGGDDPLLSATSAGSISLRASFNTGGRRSESSRSSSSRVSRGSGSYFSNSRENSGLSHIDEHSAAAPPPSSPSSHSRSSVEEPPSSEPADEADNESATASSSMLLNRRMSELRLNEASVTALQTRRAFQQMVLAMEDEDGSSDDDSDDDDTSFQRPSSSLGRVVSLGVDDYRKFQFRLRQLEELTAEQARKQANIEQTIEQEVTQRTSKVVEAMEKKIAMYKQAKDLEVEREIQRRLSIEGGRMTTAGGGSARESSFYGGQMSMLGTPPPLAPVGDLKGKPLEKLFHPRRTRRRMELLREREEQQKKEMEQFREFIRVTEMRATNSDFSMTPMASARQNSEVVVAETARASIKALRDPHITEDLLTATPNELIEMICVLRKHVSVQETQLDQAKRLISAAIEAREEAEETAREAVELTMELDTRLERASQEIVVIKDELRRSSDFSMRSSYLFKSLDSNSQVSVSAPLTATETNGILPRTASFPNL